MKSLFFIFSAALIFSSERIDFLSKYPLPVYQDIWVGNQLIASGTNICSTRYEMIKPIFERFNRPFRVLELGAAQGYFTFRLARDFPLSFYTMIEEDNPYYPYHGAMLYDLCCLNNDLSNFCYLKKQITIDDLRYLNTEEHFDIVLAFLVIHQIETDLQGQVAILESLLQMGDNLILEVCDDVACELTAFVESLSQQIDCTYLGSVKRFQNPKSTRTGKLFWFRMNGSSSEVRPIKQETFEHFNGIYPAR